MAVLPDWMIERDVKIEPFEPNLSRPGVISYGVTSYGYDVRVDRNFKVFTNARCTIVDPKNFDPQSFVDIVGDYCLIPPNSFALAETIECLEIPRSVIGICVGKSTYARCGIIVNVTPIEPEWRPGHYRDFQHHSATREDLCRGRNRSNSFHPGRRQLSHQLRRQKG